MRTIPYSQVERGLAAIAGIDPANILAHEKIQFTEFINDAVSFIWNYYPWAESTRVEKRYFRPEWDEGSDYEIGDIVYYQNKYFKKFADDSYIELQNWDRSQGPSISWDNDPFIYGTGENPEDSTVWHETGDIFTADTWQETGLYEIGSLVSYEDEIYVCIAQLGRMPANAPDSSLYLVNFSQNGINIDNRTYWQKVDTTFERFIGYEQEGEEIIGTVFSVHAEDPRYYSAPPMNFQNGREGIYVDLHTETNYVWVKFREEPPVYSSDEPEAEVLNYLAPAIKNYAYRSFLISDGQNEKAVLQGELALDTLVREVDKLAHQQDRGFKGLIA
tara:strand:- start:10715 stop:11707 length:993 start_codon:yes stop_codon:yes gene_type:complete